MQSNECGRRSSVRKKWQNTLTTFKKKRSFLLRQKDVDVRELQAADCKIDDDVHVKKHAFVHTFDDWYSCNVCSKNVNQSGYEYDGLICQRCGIAVHINCKSSDDLEYCSKARRQPPKEILIHTISMSSNENDSLENSGDGRCIDPIYLALKKANEMATNRRQVESGSLSSKNNSYSTSPAAITPPPSILSDHLDSTIRLGASFLLCAGSNKNNVRSTPNLAEQRDSPIQRTPSRTVLQPKEASVRRRAPKLDSKMKSLSLDCPESSMNIRTKHGPGFATMTNKHAVRVPTLTDSNSDNDMAHHFLGSFLCSFQRCEAINVLPNPLYAVTHDYYAKFSQEINLRVGELVLILENKDQDWWKGRNTSGKVGIFPSTCVSHVHTNERIMQVLQNVHLMDGNKNLRLYRDQVVFALADKLEYDNFTTIRTEHGHRINCPTNYLHSLE